MNKMAEITAEISLYALVLTNSHGKVKTHKLMRSYTMKQLWKCRPGADTILWSSISNPGWCWEEL